MLVHGSAGADETWSRQRELASRWSLVIPNLRGYGASPPTRRQDFERSARDVAALLDEPAHVVAFSYGGVAGLMLATWHPELVRSLTLLEPPLFSIAADVPSIERLRTAFLDPFARGEAGREQLAEALRTLSAPAGAESRPMSFTESAVRVARFLRARPAVEAQPDLDALRRAPFPSLVVSGGHHEGLDLVCDRLASAIAAERTVLEGGGHFVPYAPGFNDRLEHFLAAAERARAWPQQGISV